MNTTHIAEPIINDLHSAHIEPMLIVVERELDAVDRKLNANKQWRDKHPDAEPLIHYFNGQKSVLEKLRRNLAATQASAIERETGA